jgi:hypothetical protein
MNRFNGFMFAAEAVETASGIRAALHRAKASVLRRPRTPKVTADPTMADAFKYDMFCAK